MLPPMSLSAGRRGHLRPGDWVEIVDRHVTTLDLPNAVAPYEMISIGRTDHLHAVVVQRAHTVDVTFSYGVVRTLKNDCEVTR